MNKKLIMFMAVVGSMVGGYLPILWGGSLLGGVSILLGMFGGFAGIWFGVWLSRRFG